MSEEIYLDEDFNIIDADKARWLITITYNENGKFESEEVVDLKEKEKIDKVLGRTIGTQIEVNVGEKLIVKKIENRLYGVIGKSTIEKEDNLDNSVSKEEKET